VAIDFERKLGQRLIGKRVRAAERQDQDRKQSFHGSGSG
jgi:hypothetical protein